MANSTTKTYNFSLRQQDSYLCEDAEQIRDKRNNILSENTKIFDFRGYINYLKTLQSLSNKWVNYGYFDLGMVPLAMGPSHFQPHLMEFIKLYCPKKDITYYELPGVALMPGGFASGMKDIWVFREELCKEIGFKGNPLTFSVIDYIEKEVYDEWKRIIPTGGI